MFHDHPHGGGLGHRVRPQAANLGRCPFGMGQHQDRREPFDRLEGERPLLREVPAGGGRGGPATRCGAFSACAMRPSAPGDLCSDLGGGPADLLVGLGQQFGQRQFDVVGDPVHLGEPFLANLVEERPQPLFVQPGRRFRQVGHGGQRDRAARLG